MLGAVTLVCTSGALAPGVEARATSAPAILTSVHPAQTQAPARPAQAPAPNHAQATVVHEGYRAAGSDGGVFDFGTDVYVGSLPGQHVVPAAPIVGMAPTPTGLGYWLVGTDGGVFALGRAPFYGSMGGVHLAAPVVAMAATPDGGGYWLASADGGVFAFGDAAFYGSLGGVHLAAPIVGIASTPDGGGYWLASADGGVFAFGDAAFLGSLAGVHLAQPIVAVTSAFSGEGSSGAAAGYWLLGRDGGVFAFGIPYEGSLPSRDVTTTGAVDMAPTLDNQGYWVATATGTVYAFGDAPFLGDFETQETARGTPSAVLNGPWTTMSTVGPEGAGAVAPSPVITLADGPQTAASQQVGTPATFDLTVTVGGKPDVNTPVKVTVTGANPRTLTATTGASGTATVTYSGSAAGTDTLIATTAGPYGTVSSNQLTMKWVRVVLQAATSPVSGNFFAEPAGQTSFVAKPGDTPAFSQTFPDLAFDPPGGLLPVPPGAPTPSTVPFTDVLTDTGGAYAGVVPAGAGGFQAGVATTAGDLTNFDAVFNGNLIVTSPGYLTVGVIAADGFMFGVGGATAYSGQVIGTSGPTPFDSYPMMAADDACLDPAANNNSPQPADFPVTIYLPKAGTYPYEMDYFSCDTSSGNAPMRSLVLRSESFSSTPPTTPTVYLAYADTSRQPNNLFHYFPYPWVGTPGVNFQGCAPASNCGYDAGAIRVDNTTDAPLTLDKLVVSLATTTLYGQPNNPYSCVYDVWAPDAPSNVVEYGQPAVVLQPGQTVIYTQEVGSEAAGCNNGDGEFDSSDVPDNCTPSTIIPQVALTVDGTTSTYADTNQILNTKGIDKASCVSPLNNESTPWTRIAGPGTGADVPLAPDAALTLAPIQADGGGPLTDEVGAEQHFSVTATGADGQPITGLAISLKVTGADSAQLQADTDSSGVAQFAYGGTGAGTDTVSAIASYQGLELASGQTTVDWQIPPPGQSTGSGGTTAQAPPLVGSVTPADGAAIDTPTPVAATVTPPSGDTITSWTATLTSELTGQQNSPITLGSGSGAPPATLGTIDPTSLESGNYTLDISAVSSGGGVVSTTQQVTVTGSYKPGRYQAVYQDVSFPADGFSVGVQRAYDSFDKSVGDFGVGWRLQLSSWSVGSDGPLGAGGWTATPTSCSLFGCNYNYTSSRSHQVTVTDPAGHEEVFDFTPNGGSGPLYFLAGNPGSFTAATPRTTGSLSVFNDPGLYYGFDGNLYNAALAGSGLYAPTEFVYTEANGTELLLDTTRGLISELEPDGNCLTFGSSGIASYTGVPAGGLATCSGASGTGPALTFTRDGSGRITALNGPNGQTYTYTYDSAGDLVTVTPPAPTGPDTYTYDSNHDLLTQTGPGTPLTTLTYDASGRLVGITDAAGHSTTITNDLGTRQTIVGDPNGQLVTTYTSDAAGDIVSESRVVGSTTLTDTYTYDGLGDVTSHTDPDGHVTKATYDASGNVTSFTDALGHTTDLVYNSLGEVTSETGPAGTVDYTATYDQYGELLSSTDADGKTTTYTYAPGGQVATSTDPLGNVTSYGYDGSGDVTSIQAPSGQQVTMTYDALGNVLSETDGAGHTTNYSYDSEGRLLSITDGNGNATRSFTYTPLGQVATETDGAGGVTTFAYDSTDRMVSRTDANGVTATYTYDADGHLTGLSVPDGSGSTYVYDGFGRLTGADNTTTDVTLAWDPAGQLLSQTTGGGSQPDVTLTYGHDAAGNTTSLTGPGGTTTYAYGTSSQLTSITDPTGGVFAFGHDPAQVPVSLTRPNGVDDTYAHDAAGDLLSQTSTLGTTTVQSLAYTFNPNGLVATAPAGTYTYNGANQLTGLTPPTGPAQTYSYDAAGNLTASPTLTSPAYNADDQLTSDSTGSYAYDADGNLVSYTPTSGSAVTYGWNDLGQLVSVKGAAGTTTYGYDALGRRVEVDAPGPSVSRYVLNGVNPVAAYNGANQLQASWVNGLGAHTPLEMTAGTAHYYYLSDDQGSVTALTDSSGAVVDSYSYGPYGATSSTGSVANPFGYTGQMLDGSTGLYYYGSRYYDPSTGRFLSPDPALGPNPYAYAEGDPVNLVDPTGAEAMVETAYLGLVNEQMNVAMQIQKVVACLAAQTLYIVLAMRGFDLTPPSLAQATSQLWPNIARSYTVGQLGTSLSLANSALEESEWGGYTSAAKNGFPFLTQSPGMASAMFLSSKVASALDINGQIPALAFKFYNAYQYTESVAAAAEAAANGDSVKKACEDIKKVCAG